MRATGAVEVVTPPSGTVLDATAFDAHVLPDGSAGDSVYKTALLTAVDPYVEQYLGRSLLSQVRRVWFDCVDAKGFQLPYGPVQSVASVTFYGRDDTPTVVASSVYQLDAVTEPARLVLRFGQIWPYDLRAVNAVAVQYACGYGATGASVPASILHAMKLILAQWYEERQLTTPGYVAPLPHAADALLALHRLSTGLA